MTADTLPEFWLRGPVAQIPGFLQPAAHALLQAKEEIHQLLEFFDESKLWDRPAGVASVAFHLQHIAGVLDRLLTYASDQPLDQQQLGYLSSEGKAIESITLKDLISKLDNQIDQTIERLKAIPESKLLEERFVGRKRLPSSVHGLIFHAAEHTMRHTGQLHVTVKILTDKTHFNQSEQL